MTAYNTQFCPLVYLCCMACIGYLMLFASHHLPFGTLPLLLFVTAIRYIYIYMCVCLSNIHQTVQTSLLLAVDGFGLEPEMAPAVFQQGAAQKSSSGQTFTMGFRVASNASNLGTGSQFYQAQSPQQLPSSTDKQP